MAVNHVTQLQQNLKQTRNLLLKLTSTLIQYSFADYNSQIAYINLE